MDSVFTATTLPVSTTTQGTFLNQVFVGMFRPDAQFSPRWVGNLKQYQLGFDQRNPRTGRRQGPDAAVLGGTGFFSPRRRASGPGLRVLRPACRPARRRRPATCPTAPSWRRAVWRSGCAGTTCKARAGRKVYTLPSTPPAHTALHCPLHGSNPERLVGVRPGDDRVGARRSERAERPGRRGIRRLLAGRDGTARERSATTGARHSIHGDVLHSRPVAINYGGDEVVVLLRLQRRLPPRRRWQKTGTTAGHELWSFIAPEHYAMLKRQRAGTPKLLHLPETDSRRYAAHRRTMRKPKDYAHGRADRLVRTLQAGAAPVKEAMIFTSMRRGGNDRVRVRRDQTRLRRSSSGRSSRATDGFERSRRRGRWPSRSSTSPTSGDPPVVVVMGGGYDVAEEKNQTGHARAATGSTSSTAAPALAQERRDRLLGPGRRDGRRPGERRRPDRAYAVDVRGNVYRIDLPTSGDVPQPDHLEQHQGGQDRRAGRQGLLRARRRRHQETSSPCWSARAIARNRC